jgi:hypothetical protein
MTWKYVIYASSNTVKDSRGGFATEQEALDAGRATAKELVSSVNAPGGQEILSVDATEEKN